MNSVGIITARGRTLLVAVLTQHNADFADGRDLVEDIAEIATRAITG